MKSIKNKGELLLKRRKEVVQKASLEDIIRGTLIKRYLECIRLSCKCHKNKRNRHGPYYFLTIRKKDKSYHTYIPKEKIKKVKEWIKNYDKLWEVIEEVTEINKKLIKIRGNNEKRYRNKN